MLSAGMTDHLHHTVGCEIGFGSLELKMPKGRQTCVPMRVIITLVAFSVLLRAQIVTLPSSAQAVPAQGRFGMIGGAAPNVFFNGQPGQIRQPVGPSDCAVDGSVVNSVTGEIVPRAHVALMSAGGQSSVAADNGGRWSFSNVACGPVQVMVSRPGFIQQNLAPGNRLGIPAFAQPKVLVSGTPLHDLKVQLTPQAVIVGKVIDDQGDPVMNVQVNALTSRVMEGRRAVMPAGPMATTNDLGEFRLAGLPAGRYFVCAHANMFGGIEVSGNSTVMGESCFPGPVDAGAAGAMEIAAGRESRIDFTLHSIPAVHVRGVVTGLPKNQGIGVQFIRRGANIGRDNHPVRMLPDGRFEIGGITPGSYLAACDNWDGGKRMSARVPVEVGSSDVEGIVLALQPGFSVAGAVRMVSGGPPKQQIAINMRSTEPMGGGGGQPKWSADHSTFTIDDLPAGNYRLDAFSQGPLNVRSATLGGRDILHQEIAITQSMGPIDVVLSDESGMAEGDVTDSGDRPVMSWVMLLQPGRMPRNFMTGQDGHFKLQNLPAGDYQVFAWDDVQEVEYADDDWMKRHASGVPLSIQEGQTARIKLTQQPVH